MNCTVEIDSESGFCYGVIRAVETAEENLKTTGRLFSLGSIVHNSVELERLSRKGLSVIDIEEMTRLHNETVLIRAHGEPPQTYRLAEENNIRLIDCTCPVVLKLQERIRNTYASKAEGCQIVLFGKKGHAEVNGLVGQVKGDAIVVTSSPEGDHIPQELERVDFSRQIEIFSQTTKDPLEFKALCSYIAQRQREYNLSPVIHDTICKRVAMRHHKLRDFARSHSIIIFVSGRESSNGKVLYDLCKSVNPRSRFIQESSEIETEWFTDGDTIGICGATSTPKWQLERVASHLESLLACRVL